MVQMKNDDQEDTDVEITNEQDDENTEHELVDVEEQSTEKLKKMRGKITRLEEEKKHLLDDMQRQKAEFLNARKRLEDERARDKVRCHQEHIIELLPLCDSFDMAMGDQETWEKADEAWRKGIEGIYGQLKRILAAHNVQAIEASGEPFDPHKHEAVGTEPVTETNMEEKVVSVVQKGYQMEVDGQTEILRPARVTTGIVN